MRCGSRSVTVGRRYLPVSAEESLMLMLPLIMVIEEVRQIGCTFVATRVQNCTCSFYMGMRYFFALFCAKRLSQSFSLDSARIRRFRTDSVVEADGLETV